MRNGVIKFEKKKLSTLTSILNFVCKMNLILMSMSMYQDVFETFYYISSNNLMNLSKVMYLSLTRVFIFILRWG